jgi:Ca2+-binding EF-hand superfamily protein
VRSVALLAGALLVAGAASAQPKPTPDLLPEDVRVRFETADRDDSGNLTQDEAIKGGYSSNAFAAVDSDGDQIITVTEIGTYLADRTTEWVKADSDKDGTISRDEAEQAPTIKSVFTNADRDSDGILRKQEHEAWAQTSLYQNVDLPYVVPNIINKKF